MDKRETTRPRTTILLVVALVACAWFGLFLA